MPKTEDHPINQSEATLAAFTGSGDPCAHHMPHVVGRTRVRTQPGGHSQVLEAGIRQRGVQRAR